MTPGILEFIFVAISCLTIGVLTVMVFLLPVVVVGTILTILIEQRKDNQKYEQEED